MMKNKIWKVALCGLLAIAMLLPMTACDPGRNGGGGVKFDGELEKNVTIRVLENDTAITQGYFAEILAAFNEKYKDDGIVAVDAKMDQYLDLEKDGPYGYGPDLLYQANDIIMKYVKGKHVLPLPVDKLSCYNEVSERAWNAYTTTVDGQKVVCGVPVNVQGPLLFYRKDMLPQNWQTEWDANKNDIPDMAESWSAMYQYSKQIRAAGDTKKFGYMKSLYDVYFSSGFLFSYGAYVFGDNDTNVSDIGFSKGEAVKGANVLRQLASLMDLGCTDDTITRSSYSKMAKGEYFATMTTPDVTSLFIREMVLNYKAEGLSETEATKKARENLVICDIPKLPRSGDLEEKNPELIPFKSMGGVNGYAISSYTKYPDTCLAFVDFATDYAMVKKRVEILDIVPARADVATEAGGLTEIIYNNLAGGRIYLMPSVREVAQIWTPGETFFKLIANDPFLTPAKQKYTTLAAMQTELERLDKNVYDAIHTFG